MCIFRDYALENMKLLHHALLSLQARWKKWEKKYPVFLPHLAPVFFLLTTWWSFFVYLFAHAIQVRPDGLYFGHTNIWSDWSLHVGIARIFAVKNPGDWLAYHPLYAYGKFTYGFLTNAISGWLMRFGMPLTAAFFWPSILFAALFMLGAYAVLFQLIRKRWVAVVALFIFFLSAGLGFVRFIPDWQEAPSWQTVLHPPQEYSQFWEYQWGSGNVIVGMLLPQRAFLLGITLALWSYFCFLRVLLAEKRLPLSTELALATVGGMLAGILPITHMHSFLALIALCVPLSLWCFKKEWRFIIFYAGVAGCISVPIYTYFIHGGIENQAFFQWMIGWTAPEGFLSWVKQWAWQWGLTLPTAVLGMWFVWQQRGRKGVVAFSGFWLIFLVGNTVLLQPTAWDNSKFFLWAYLGLSGLSAMVLNTFWRKKVVDVALVAVLFFFLTATGFLEMIKLARFADHTYLATTTQTIQLGEKISRETDPRAVFATAPAHNHFITMWAARPILLGYTGWVWNFGFQYHQREADLKQLFAGTERTPEIIEKYDVSYVVIGPGEVTQMQANAPYFAENYSVAFSNGEYIIYDVRASEPTNR